MAAPSDVDVRSDVTVVLSTYNRADGLPAALDALLAQAVRMNVSVVIKQPESVPVFQDMGPVISVGGACKDVELIYGRNDFAHDQSDPTATGSRSEVCRRQYTDT